MPHVIDASSELSLALHEYSLMLRISRRTDDAQLAFQEAFDLRKRLHQQDATKIGNRVLLSRLNCSQGAFDREKGNFSGANSQFQQAISLLVELVDGYPNVYEYHHELHSALIHQIEVCLFAENADVGKSAWRDLAVRLLTARTMFPDDKKVASRVAYWLPGWADQLWEDGQQTAARQLYQLAVETALWLYTASLPAPAETEALLANNAAWTMVTSINDEKRDLPQAKELAQRAVSLSPEKGAYLHTLGTVLIRLGEPGEAKEILIRAITLEKQVVNRKLFAQVTPLLRELLGGNAEATREVFARTMEFGKPKDNDLQILNATLLLALSTLNEQPPTDLIVDPKPGFSIDGPLLRRLTEEARTLAVTKPDK
jgi:tetratricopeptide (TPR) repeat protein